RLSSVAHTLPARPGADDEDERARCHQHARSCQARARENFAGLDIGGLWRSDRASAEGRLLGPRQPDRAALLLRRRQALRRDVVLRLLAAAQIADQGRAHLQYLWAAHASA